MVAVQRKHVATKKKGTRRLNRMPHFGCYAKFFQTRFPQGCICLRRSGWVKIAISGRCSNRMPPGITNPNVKKHVVSLGGTYFRFRVRFKLVTI